MEIEERKKRDGDEGNKERRQMKDHKDRRQSERAQAIKKEDKVKELGNYLKDVAIQNLIKNLQKNEGIPTDSESLKQFFHQNGINIRYLGYIADQIKDKNLT